MRLITAGELLTACQEKTNTRLHELDDGHLMRLQQSEALIHNAFADLLPDALPVYVYADAEPDAFFLITGELVLCVSSKTAAEGLTEQRLILCGAVEDLVQEGPFPEFDVPAFNAKTAEAEA